MKPLHIHVLFPQFLIYLLVCLFFFAIPERTAAFKAEDEYSIKAAFIYNFTKFIEWPDSVFASPQAPFVIGIIGGDPFGKALEPLKVKTIKGHPLEIKFISNLNEIDSLQVLYISSSEKHLQASICKSIRGPVLTISDTEQFIEDGGGIQLMTVNKKIQYAINIDVLKSQELDVSSHLLNLAIKVWPKSE